ncbi:MAG: hypothetical protein PHW82_06865 [Bacteroidales bacterium]|nr:hypothetical protein [Bacteroidales bacterium]
MKKVLILAYFYPPCNLTAARRAEAFAVYLNKFGYYPIVVTRAWLKEINSPADVLKSSGDKLRIVKNDDYEVHYLPYKSSFRDMLFIRFGKTKLKFLSKILTIIGLIGQNYCNLFIPYRNLYKHSLKLIKSELIDYAVITANPFEIFKFGYLLNKKTEIKWIADYRDDWNTSELDGYLSKNRVLKFIERNAEKKWIKSATLFTTISPYYLDKISQFTGKKGVLLLNGHNNNIYNEPIKDIEYYPEFTIVYNGTLYASQEIEIFLEGFKAALFKMEGKGLKILFPGLAFDKQQASRVSVLLKGFENNYTIFERLPFKEVLKIQTKSHLMLMLPHKSIKGIPSSKLYEYIGLGKHIATCPGDDDIIEETIKEYGMGYVLQSKAEVCDFLIYCLDNKDKFEISHLSVEQKEKISLYSRKSQVLKLATELNNL